MLRMYYKASRYAVLSWLMWLLSWIVALTLLAVVYVWDFFEAVWRAISNAFWRQVEKSAREEVRQRDKGI